MWEVFSRLRAPLEQCSGPCTRSQQVAATCLASGARSREATPRYFAQCDGYQSSSAQGVTGTSERPQFRTKARMRVATTPVMILVGGDEVVIWTYAR